MVVLRVVCVDYLSPTLACMHDGGYDIPFLLRNSISLSTILYYTHTYCHGACRHVLFSLAKPVYTFAVFSFTSSHPHCMVSIGGASC